MRDRDFIDRLLDIQESLVVPSVHDKRKQEEFEFVSDMIVYLIKIQEKEDMKTAKVMKEKTEAALYRKHKHEIENIIQTIQEQVEQGEGCVYCDDINYYVKQWLQEKGYRVYVAGRADVKIAWRD